MSRFRSTPKLQQSPYNLIYSVPAVCHINEGNEIYTNTEAVEWKDWLGRYTHKGMRPPEFYYPNGPYNIDGVLVESGIGCRAIGVTGFTTYGASGGATGDLVTSSSESYSGNGCLIVYGGPNGASSFPNANVNNNLGSFRELQTITEESKKIAFYAYPSPPPATITTAGIFSSSFELFYNCNECCDIKYMVVDGEFPPDLILNMETGVASGFISEMDLPDKPGDPNSKDYFMKRWKLPPDYRITEKNYATVGSASSFANGKPATNTARFIIRAFNARDPRVFNDKEFTITITNNWSSDRDRLILNINNQFFLDGKPVTNREYLLGMKKRGYFD